ncbi:MAG: deoxyguanosinetriphosphate triphosphohydrolase, partial [Candidatus Saganbacteria bacterium]|nr:deoxyguanosinetriphosphate triphosphohydrolase [Candidatus Saganbacteria bacterium]
KTGQLPKKHTEVLGKHMLDTIIFDIVRTSKGKPYVKMSKKVATAVQGMYDFLYKKVYTNPIAKAEETKVPAMLKLLFRHYLYNPKTIPDYKKSMGEKELLQLTVDFIAQMSDLFATDKFREVFIPQEWHK